MRFRDQGSAFLPDGGILPGGLYPVYVDLEVAENGVVTGEVHFHSEPKYPRPISIGREFDLHIPHPDSILGDNVVLTVKFVDDSGAVGGYAHGSQAQFHPHLSKEPPKTESAPMNTRDVFVIHGRDERLRAGMFDFLKSLDLHPMEWEYAVKLTGKATPYVGQVLDAAFSRAQAVVVLFTPDDVAKLRPDLRGIKEPEHETDLTPQSRPNVLFEAGMAMAKNADRTILVEIGALRPFSDAGGRHAIRMDNSVEKRKALALRLQNAGCDVNLNGDWEKHGDLSAPHRWADSTPDQLLSLERAVERLESENSKLRDMIARRNQEPSEPELRHVGAVNYYFVGDKGPYCQPCYDEKGKRIFLTPPQEWNGGIRRKCKVCNKFFYEKPMDLGPADGSVRIERG